MAENTVTPSVDASTAKRAVLFEPFEYWPHARRLDPRARQLAQLASRTRDVAEGVRDILALLEQENVDAVSADGEGNPTPQLLPVNVLGNLHRLGIVALNMLAEQADEIGEAVEKEALRQPGTGDGARA